MLVEFIEAPVFTRLVGSYLSDDDYRLLQWTLAKDPERGDVVPGTGGVRKLRWEDRRRGKGKRGGLRVMYHHFSSDGQIWLLTLYDKGETTDLTARERAALRRALEDEKRVRRGHRDSWKER
jgi:hypothetical protein